MAAEVNPGARAGALLRARELREGFRPEDVGWRYLSLRVVEIPAGGRDHVGDPASELVAVVDSGSAVARVGGERWVLDGRSSVFEGLPWALYLPAGTTARIESPTGCRLDVIGARSDRSGEPHLIPPDEVDIELRGAGSATREIRHIVPPGFPAHRILVVEVLTPAGNWSSYPPHKHDVDDGEREADLEEFYLFHVRPAEGFGFQRVYSPSRGEDVSVAVHDGDVVLVPYGYHVSGAPHAFDLSYLNGLAGDRRSMAASDDPELAWIRPTWEGGTKDPRLPFPSGR